MAMGGEAEELARRKGLAAACGADLLNESYDAVAVAGRVEQAFEIGVAGDEAPDLVDQRRRLPRGEDAEKARIWVSIRCFVDFRLQVSLLAATAL
jgi:hypothetical protein